MSFPYARVAVTGASGMVGRQLIEQLASENVTVLAASRRKPPETAGRVVWQAWDLTSWRSVEELDALFPDAEVVIHAGAAIPGHSGDLDERALFDANVRACFDLGMWACAREIPLVFLSSSTVYAEPEREGIRETDTIGPNAIGGVYGHSKRLAEDVFLGLAAEGLRVNILRPSSIYGPGMPENKMMIRFLKMANAESKISLLPPTKDRHDLVHAQDVAAACVVAIEAGTQGIFNIGGGRSVSVAEIARACVAVVGRGTVELPTEEGLQAASVRFGLDCTAARSAFGYQASMTLETGVESLWRGLCADQLEVSL